MQHVRYMTSALESLIFGDKCRSPLVSFVYERGWRQGFSWGGFPGEAREFDMAMEYLESAFGEVCPPHYAEWIAVKEWLCFCRQVNVGPTQRLLCQCATTLSIGTCRP